MLVFEPWKTWVVVVTCLLGVLLAVPNLVSRKLVETLPSWVPTRQVSLGLDLQGGSHLLLEVDLASVTKERLNGALESPPFNLVIHTSPFSEDVANEYHWHVEIMPKLTRVAGFEWGTGFYINPTPPEEAAAVLRGVRLQA